MCAHQFFHSFWFEMNQEGEKATTTTATLTTTLQRQQQTAAAAMAAATAAAILSCIERKNLIKGNQSSEDIWKRETDNVCVCECVFAYIAKTNIAL